MKLTIEQFKIKKPQDKHIPLNDTEAFERLVELHGGTTIAERKYDGNGIIIDTRDEVKLYSLGKKQWNIDCLPELKGDLLNLPAGFFVGELVGRPTTPDFSNLDEFTAVQGRSLVSPSILSEERAHTHPLEIRIYDILALNGDITATLPNYAARELVEATMQYGSILPVERFEISSGQELQKHTLEQIAKGKEGFVVKKKDSQYSKDGFYVKGSRNADWVKLKRSVTFDLAALGLDLAPKREEQGWPCSNVLLGTYNERTGKFETMTKMNIPNQSLAEELYERMAPHLSENRDEQVRYAARIPSKKVPQSYTQNPLEHAPVIEVTAMDVTSPKDTWHSCGIDDGQRHSLRQPVYVRMREKLPPEATSTQQVQNYVTGI